MIARICLGVKCSTSLVGAHFTDNPGVTQVLKDYLKNRMKCLVPVLPEEALNLTRKQILDQNDLDTKKVMMMQLKDPGKTIFQTKDVAHKTSLAVSKGASEKPSCQVGPTEVVSPVRSAMESKSQLESAHSLESP